MRLLARKVAREGAAVWCPALCPAWGDTGQRRSGFRMKGSDLGGIECVEGQLHEELERVQRGGRNVEGGLVCE